MDVAKSFSGVRKGDYGYLDFRRRSSLIKCLVFLLATLLLVLCARVFFPSIGRIFLILAILSALPAAVSAVSLVMSMRFKSGRREVYEAVEAVRNGAPVFYDAVLTTREESYGVNCLIFLNKNIMAYTEYPDSNAASIRSHLTEMARKGGFKDWTIKVYTELPEFIERLSFLKDKDVRVLEKDGEMRDLIGQIAL
ncbi:MAG: hypothetical protein J6O55_02630 [Lachnospiraceae bacterium]|nr:hypothetical protein [Lachnospiraceae bacterium]